MGRVCEKHAEFYETECRWCEPAPDRWVMASKADPAGGAAPADTEGLMDEMWAKLAARDAEPAPSNAAIPARGLGHTWALSDFCMTCGRTGEQLRAAGEADYPCGYIDLPPPPTHEVRRDGARGARLAREPDGRMSISVNVEDD